MNVSLQTCCAFPGNAGPTPCTHESGDLLGYGDLKDLVGLSKGDSIVVIGDAPPRQSETSQHNGIHVGKDRDRARLRLRTPCDTKTNLWQEQIPNGEVQSWTQILRGE